MIHYTAKGNIAHNFLRLKEGSIYSIRNFAVHPNKDDFRVVKHATFMLEFDGSTTIYNLPENRGQALRVTLWGGLGDVLIKKKIKHARMCAVVLTSMSAKHYNNKLYLSSSSSTTIYDDESIPTLQELKKGKASKATVPVDFSQPKEGTLENVLIWARNRKNDTSTFDCKVMIENVRTRKGWNYPSRGGGDCKKGTTRQLGKWFCEACNKAVEYHVIRYILELGVAEDTAHVVVVLFDEPIIELVKCSTESLLAAVDESVDEDSNLPTAITNLVGTTHVLELKSHTYYEYGTFESFTYWKVNPTPMVDEGTSSSTVDENADTPSPTFKRLSWTPSVCTPSKGLEEKKKKRSGVEDSDVDEGCGSSKKTDECDADARTDKKKKKSDFRYSDDYGSE
ncbi:DNA helicase PIF1, ATP-dependent [Tanacetum coccineum]